MIKDLPITAKLQNYVHAYLQAGYQERHIPPYRITCEEHKEFLQESNIMFGKQGKDMLKSYYGVEIQVVVIVPPYC